MTDTLLAHLSWKLSSHHEDIAVEALGYILKSESARRTVTDMLEKHGAKVAPIERFKTQVTQKDRSRPDLVGLDRNNDTRVIIEAKFWAGLTDNQPNAYLNRLPAKGALLVVAPAQRIESLWAELRNLAKVNRPRPDNEKADFKSVLIDDHCYMMLTSWRHLLEWLEAASDAHSRNGIQELRGFVDRIDQDAFLPIRSVEFAPEIPRRMLNLIDLVKDTVTRAKNDGWISTTGLRVTAQATGYGRYVYVAEAGGWFGIDFARWARADYPDTPLWLRLQEWDGTVTIAHIRQALEELFQSDPPGCFDEGEGLCVPIMLPTAVEHPAVLNAVVARIQYVANQISGANLHSESI